MLFLIVCFCFLIANILRNSRLFKYAGKRVRVSGGKDDTNIVTRLELQKIKSESKCYTFETGLPYFSSNFTFKLCIIWCCNIISKRFKI